MSKNKIPVAMSIAGSDSGGGAGIEADLKTFAALNVHGTVALTAITAQNTYGVFAIQDVNLDVIEKQIDVVAEDIGIDAAKTGMLHRVEVIELVAKKVKQYGFPLIVDPVMIAKSGARLLKIEAEEAMKKVLTPIATVITPNAMEAEVLSGIKVKTIEDMKKAAKKIAELGPKAVVIKGGHIESGDKAIDIVYVDNEIKEFINKKIKTKNTHGTGCSFSAAITAEIAKGKSIIEAIKTAKEFITIAIEYGLPIGKGFGPVNPNAWIQIQAEKYLVLENLSKAVELLESHKEVLKLIPEVQSNIVMALPKPYAKTIKDVAGIPGRIVKFKDRVKAVGNPEFGASSHVARILLKVMEYDQNIRAAMNIKYSQEILEACKKLGFTISFFDRKEEPMEIKSIEGATLQWGVEYAIKKIGKVPDIIYDLGEVGKEPMIRIFDKDAISVAKKVIAIVMELK
ncbi:MAG: bifunctional hydroxymethylpyrimidine kinase/phosphomethylpyrimidine kinase [Nitrososphaerota archaeon]